MSYIMGYAYDNVIMVLSEVIPSESPFPQKSTYLQTGN